MNDPEQRDRLLAIYQRDVKKAINDLHLGKRWSNLTEPEIVSINKDLSKDVVSEIMLSDTLEVSELLNVKKAYIAEHPYHENCNYRLNSFIGDKRSEHIEWNRMMFLAQQFDWTNNQQFDAIHAIYPHTAGAAGILAGNMLRTLAAWKQYGICGQNYEENPGNYPMKELLKVTFDGQESGARDGFIYDPRPSGICRFTTSSHHVMSDINVFWRKYFSGYNPDRSRCSFSQNFLRTRIVVWTETKMFLELLEIPDSKTLVEQFVGGQKDALLKKVGDNVAEIEKYNITPKGIVVDFLESAQSYNRDRKFSNVSDGNILNYKLRPIFDDISGTVAEIPISNEKFNFLGDLSSELIDVVKSLMGRAVQSYLFKVKYGEKYRQHVRIFKRSKEFLINQVC